MVLVGLEHFVDQRPGQIGRDQAGSGSAQGEQKPKHQRRGVGAGEAKQTKKRTHVDWCSGFLTLGYEQVVVLLRAAGRVARSHVIEGVRHIAGGASPAHRVVPACQARARAECFESAQAAPVACR